MEVRILDSIEGYTKLSKAQDFKRPIRKIILPEAGVRQVILLPQTFAWITVSLAPETGGSATLYGTISAPLRIETDEAIWHPWPNGTITSPGYHTYENPWLAFWVDSDVRTLFELVLKNQ